jgi:hypothetical protein
VCMFFSSHTAVTSVSRHVPHITRGLSDDRIRPPCQNNATTCPCHRVHQRTSTGTNMTDRLLHWGGFEFTPPNSKPPPGAARGALPGPRSPAQLTSFCPAPLGHLGKQANGSPGRELQLSTSCNPRILQGHGMFDGKAFPFGRGGERPESTGVSKVFPGKRRLQLWRGETQYFRWTQFGIQSLRGCLFLLFGSTLVVKIKKTQESTPSVLKRITAIRRT